MLPYRLSGYPTTRWIGLLLSYWLFICTYKLRKTVTLLASSASAPCTSIDRSTRDPGGGPIYICSVVSLQLALIHCQDSGIGTDDARMALASSYTRNHAQNNSQVM
jgi:hypothetical protein